MSKIVETTTTIQLEEIVRSQQPGDFQNIQGSKTVTEYANQLKALWQELDHYKVIKTKCPDDAVVLKDFIQQDRVYDFLVGLNPKFDQVRIQILGKQEVTCFNEVVELIRGKKAE
ncbi:hypothetical protein AAG906_006462 [Vitis piasezkii]